MPEETFSAASEQKSRWGLGSRKESFKPEAKVPKSEKSEKSEKPYKSQRVDSFNKSDKSDKAERERRKKDDKKKDVPKEDDKEARRKEKDDKERRRKEHESRKDRKHDNSSGTSSNNSEDGGSTKAPKKGLADKFRAIMNDKTKMDKVRKGSPPSNDARKSSSKEKLNEPTKKTPTGLAAMFVGKSA